MNNSNDTTNINFDGILFPNEIVEFIYSDIILWNKTSEQHEEIIRTESGESVVKKAYRHWKKKKYNYMILTNQRLLLFNNELDLFDFCLNPGALEYFLIRNNDEIEKIKKIQKTEGFLNRLSKMRNDPLYKEYATGQLGKKYPPLVIISGFHLQSHLFRTPNLLPEGLLFSIIIVFLNIKFPDVINSLYNNKINLAYLSIIIPFLIFLLNFRPWKGIKIETIYLYHGDYGIKASISVQKVLNRVFSNHQIQMKNYEQVQNFISKFSPYVNRMKEAVRLHLSIRVNN